MATFITNDDTTLYFETAGNQSNPALLLLPGALGTIDTQWQTFVEPLRTDYFVIMVDLRGHGRSGNSSPNLQPDQILSDLLALLDHLSVEQLHVAGYDLGGTIGFLLALNQPRRILSLLMHATKYFWTKEFAAKMRTQLDPEHLATNAPAYAEQLQEAHGPRHWRRAVHQVADLTMQLVDQTVPQSALSHLRTPVLVSVGDRDRMVSVSEAQRLSRMLPNGSLLVLPNVQHPFRGLTAVPFLSIMRNFHRKHYAPRRTTKE